VTLISLLDIERAYGDDVVLEKVSFRVDERERIGVIGDNGAGKTTLLRILAGEEEPDRGSRTTRRDLRVAYGAQIRDFAGGSVREWVLRGNGAFQALAGEVARLEQELAASPADERVLAAYGELQAAFEAGGGYHREHLCERVLSGIGFGRDDWDKDVAVLSGGEKSRLQLCALMTTPADLLLLDEPTNHLDLPGIEFLEGFVQGSPAAVIVVSHDRRFLDATTKRILHLEGGSVIGYKGNYSAFAQQRDTNLLAAVRAHKNQREFIDKELDYIRRNMAGRNSAQAKGRLKRLERLEVLSQPKAPRAGMRLRFAAGRGQSGQTIAEFEDAAARLPDGRTIFAGVSFRLFHGETVALLGRNGAGKSTLLRAVCGAGGGMVTGRVALAHGVRAGYFSQEMQDLPREGTVLAALRALEPQAAERDLRDHLARFLFTGDDVDLPVATLSGGEKRRLCLARLTRGAYDFLALDEPTNHLDIATRERLEEALLAYTGAVLMISHDRSFVDALADRVLWLEAGRARMFDGGLGQCLERLAAERQAERAAEAPARRAAREAPAERAPAASKASPGKVRNPLLFQKLEEEIIALEEELETLRQAMTLEANYRDTAKVQALALREAELAQRLREAYARWESWS
jgi:ATP-binding cassette subfamily F protein 3